MTTPMRARFATELFLAAMRREWLALNPTSDKECPVKRLTDYDAVGQSVLVRSVTAALKSLDASQDKSFAGYERRLREEIADGLAV